VQNGLPLDGTGKSRCTEDNYIVKRLCHKIFGLNREEVVVGEVLTERFLCNFTGSCQATINKKFNV
jgi:hypothetical protein